MNAQQFQQLKTIRFILYSCLVLLILAAIASLLSSVMQYAIAIIIAAVLVGFHWLTRNNSKAAKWRKYWAMTIPTFTVLAPFIYLFYILFFASSVSKWLYFIKFGSVILPLLLVMWAIYRLQKIIDQL